MKIKNSIKIGFEDVYDLSIDHVDHSFVLDNGIIAHNCAYVVSDAAIEETVPIMEVGGVNRVTQCEAKQCEEAGLIKYDFLVVSSLRDINSCLKYINRKKDTLNLPTGHFSHEGKSTYIWNLPEDEAVFKDLADGKTETVFQLHTPGATPTVIKAKPQSIIDCATITSLERPGPKDYRDPITKRNMPEEYIERKFGRSVGEIPILNEMLPETFGILVFQEQVTKLAKELAGMNVVNSENVRIAVGKKNKELIDSLKPIFIKGASKRVDVETATKIWDMMETFARYGFNKCLSGDTLLLRNRCGSKSLTIAEMYKAKNDKEWAIEHNKESVGKKYRSFGYGKGVSKKDNRLYPNKIVDIRYEGLRDTYQITTESGKTIRATDNHKFPTLNGNVLLRDLSVGDSLFVNNGYEVKDSTYRFGGGGDNYPQPGQCGTEKIVKIELYGQEEVYDVEMEAPYHNLVTDSGIVTCNSHAVAYSVISYACAYLKHHYRYEWWAAILSNADNKKINEVYYQYVKDIVLPPDINTSTEQMSVDYKLNKIRNKLSMVSGLGKVIAENIISNRPYIDIEDFVNKKACGKSMAKKLIHIGVLDSLFPAPSSLVEKEISSSVSSYDGSLSFKMNLYEEATNRQEWKEKAVKYKEKIEYLRKLGDAAGVKRTQNNLDKHIKKGPKEHEIDPHYAAMGVKKDFLTKKSIFPTINLDLQKVLDIKSTIPVMIGGGRRVIANKRGYDNRIISGESLQRIDKSILDKNAYFCVPGYVISAEEFSFGGGKKALKLLIDSSGYVAEKVLWPDYDSGELIYPELLKKGCIAYFFYGKTEGKKDTKIYEIIVEEPSL